MDQALTDLLAARAELRAKKRAVSAAHTAWNQRKAEAKEAAAAVEKILVDLEHGQDHLPFGAIDPKPKRGPRPPRAV
jgi:signal transduction histidine kinase